MTNAVKLNMNEDVKNKPKKKNTTPKRLIIISVVTLLIGAILLTPRYTTYMDGGTREWRALGYVVVHWHSIYYEGNPGQEDFAVKNKNDVRVYLFPFSLWKLNDLYKMEYGELGR